MAKDIPEATIETFARTIHREASNYGFNLGDMIRLINALMDVSAEEREIRLSESDEPLEEAVAAMEIDNFPLASSRLHIRLAAGPDDAALLSTWMNDEYGKHFLLSSSTAQTLEVDSLLSKDNNRVGIIELKTGQPIGAMAFLDIDTAQGRAELRKLIGAPHARGQGLAEEATRLWIAYGLEKLELEKIYVSTLQTHLQNIQLNESVGFHVEGVLRQEVRIGNERYDVLRMGLVP